MTKRKTIDEVAAARRKRKAPLPRRPRLGLEVLQGLLRLAASAPDDCSKAVEWIRATADWRDRRIAGKGLR